MRGLLIVAALPLLAGLTPVDDEQVQPVVSLPIDQPTPLPPAPRAGRQRVGFACGGAPPATLAEWFSSVDAIVRVRIDAHNAYDDPDSASPSPNILTDLEVTVLDVFKLHPRAVGAGATMTITYLGGTVVRADGPDTLTINGLPPPSVGTEWFLFLNWNEHRQQFWIDYLDSGAFQVIGDRIIRPRFLGDPLFGNDADALAEALRKGGTITPPSSQSPAP